MWPKLSPKIPVLKKPNMQPSFQRPKANREQAADQHNIPTSVFCFFIHTHKHFFSPQQV
jgi:hypothetical protein